MDGRNRRKYAGDFYLAEFWAINTQETLNPVVKPTGFVYYEHMNSNYLMASLSYVGVLVLIPVISQATKDSFVAFHVRQGAVILLLEIVAIVSAQWFSKPSSVVFLGLLFLSVIAFFFTVQGEKWKIPGIFSVAQLFGK